MLRYLGSKIWQLVPREIREITSIFIHPKDKKSGFLKIVPADCKLFVPQLDFVCT